MKDRTSVTHSIQNFFLVSLVSFALCACGGGGGGGGSANAASSSTTGPAPVVTVSAASSSIAYGGSTTVTWTSTNASSCTLSGASTTLSGSINTGALTSSAIYTVTCTGSNGSATQSATVNVAPPVVSGCATTGATSAINLSYLPSRLTGVAPLSVFFDAAATTASSTTKPYLDLEYRWDFGDPIGSPVSGTTWQYGSKANTSSRNAALGPQASHVFEAPGTYAITLTVKDKLNAVTNNCVQVVVQDPATVFSGTKTMCFSTSGNFANCPTGAAQLTTFDFAGAVNTYKGTNRRLLFRRGEVFNAGSPARITVNGPGTIGAFGNASDPKPIILRTPGAGEVISVGTNTSTGDWRIMDLEIDGQNEQNQYNKGIDAANEFHQLLALRMNIHGTWRGVVGDNGLLAAGQPYMDQWALVDSTLTGIPGCNSPSSFANCDWRAMISGTRHTIQGNYMDNQDTGGSHVIRSSFMQKGVISNNYIARAGIIQHAIKIHAWLWSGGSGGNIPPGTYSEEIIISDNQIVGGINAWTVSIGPQNDVNDERVRKVLIERNWFTSGTGTNISIDTSAANSVIRNNVFTLNTITGTNGHIGVLVQQRGGEAVPDDVSVYGNSIYSKTIGSFAGVSVGAATNVVVKNNIGWAPTSTSRNMITGSGSASAIKLNNSSDSQVFSIDPKWTSSTPTLPASFRPISGSYAIGAAADVPVYSDFFTLVRSSNSMGAVEP